MQALVAQKPELYLSRETLIKTPLNYTVDMLRLSARNNITKVNHPKLKNLFPLRTNATSNYMFKKSKCNIIVSARVHSAETASNYMLEGFLDEVINNSTNPEMKQLLEKCVITIVPMLNPDGVELGYTRTDSLGNNLNAIYQKADINTPSIYALKKIIRYLEHRNGIRIYLDFHAHMTKRGFFMFGNPLKSANYNDVLLFPFLLQQRDPRTNMKVSSFGSFKDEFTSRKEISGHIKSQSVYTIESNYWGNTERISELKSKKLVHNNLRIIDDFKKFYRVRDFQSFGEHIARTIAHLLTWDTVPQEEKQPILDKMTKYYDWSMKRIENITLPGSPPLS